MAYTGTIDLISGLRPKNDQSFPLVNAKDVYVDDTHRLNDTLAGLEGSFVRYDAAQELTDGQKAQALANVGGASEQDVDDLKDDLNDIHNTLYNLNPLTPKVATANRGLSNAGRIAYIEGLTAKLYDVSNINAIHIDVASLDAYAGAQGTYVFTSSETVANMSVETNIGDAHIGALKSLVTVPIGAVSLCVITESDDETSTVSVLSEKLFPLTMELGIAGSALDSSSAKAAIDDIKYGISTLTPKETRADRGISNVGNPAYKVGLTIKLYDISDLQKIHVKAASLDAYDQTKIVYAFSTATTIKDITRDNLTELNQGAVDKDVENKNNAPSFVLVTETTDTTSNVGILMDKLFPLTTELGVEGSAIDSAAVKGKIDDVQFQIDETTNELLNTSKEIDALYSSFASVEATPIQLVSQRALSDNGTIVYDDSKVAILYSVTSGEILHLELHENTGTNKAVYAFTSASQISKIGTSSIIGDVAFGAVSDRFIVPDGASNLVVVQASTDEGYYVNRIEAKDYQQDINNLKNGAYEFLRGTFEKGSILNGASSTTDQRIRHTKPIKYDRDVMLFVKEDYMFYVCFYSDNTNTSYIEAIAPVDNKLPISIPANRYFRAVIYKQLAETVSNINEYIGAVYVTTDLFIDKTRYINRLVRQVAHQGYSLYPKDSVGHSLVEAYRNAAMVGFTHGETDIVFTSDGIPVCCHDATFKDATTQETITISQTAYEELITYNYYGGTIASFEQIVQACKINGLGIYIDHLDGSWDSEKWNALFAIVQKYNMAKNAFWLLPAIASSLTSPIKTWFQDANFIRVFTTVPDDFDLTVENLNTLKTSSNIVAASLNASIIPAADLPTYTAKLTPGLELEVWTVDTVSSWYDYLPYVSAITSNKICANIARKI